MKKFISVIAIMLMLALTACSNKETPPTTDNSSNTQSDSVTMLEEGVSTQNTTQKGGYVTMNYHDWRSEQNPIRRTAKRLLSGDPLKDGRPLSELIELDEHARKCLAFEATLTDQQIEMLQELGYLPSPGTDE